MPADDKRSPPVGKALWAYGYQINPPKAEHRMQSIRDLLDQENGEAKSGAGTWTARLVVEERVTHVLIVSDSPSSDHEINRTLEARMRELDVGFSMMAPMPVSDRIGSGGE